MIKAWLAAAAVGVLLAAGIAVQTARLGVARGEAARERDRADAHAAVLRQMQADARLAARIAADYAAQIAQLREQDRALRNRIAAAADGGACAQSPAMRELLDGVRREGAPDDGGAPSAR